MALDPGQYTVRELLEKAEVDPTEVAKVDYNDRGWDNRLFRVGGLRFDDLDDVIEVPEGATELEITVDSNPVASLAVNTREVPEAAANFKALEDSK